VHVPVDGCVRVDVRVCEGRPCATRCSRVARRGGLAEMRVRAQRSATMSCAGCGETEADGAIFGSADGQCFRCNRPAPATVAPTSASLSELEAKSAELSAQTVAQLKALCGQHGVSKTGVKAELVVRLCDALCTGAPAAKRPRT
jgi:hypothetical protein